VSRGFGLLRNLFSPHDIFDAPLLRECPHGPPHSAWKSSTSTRLPLFTSICHLILSLQFFIVNFVKVHIVNQILEEKKRIEELLFPVRLPK
jgi:hypothetical protein